MSGVPLTGSASRRRNSATLPCCTVDEQARIALITCNGALARFYHDNSRTETSTLRRKDFSVEFEQFVSPTPEEIEKCTVQNLRTFVPVATRDPLRCNVKRAHFKKP